LGKIFGNSPMVLYNGLFQSLEVSILLNGKCSHLGVDHIGNQVATLAAHVAIEHLNPELVINAGTAGGFISRGGKIGDVYMGSPHVCYHDRRINLPRFKEYGIGFYPTADCPELANELGLKTGVVSTGSSLDFTQNDLDTMSSYNAAVKDMEAAAIAWVAQLHKIPFMAIKAITDLVDNDVPAENEFTENLQTASNALSAKMVEILSFISREGLR
jgi:nucleoside phosphorylase